MVRGSRVCGGVKACHTSTLASDCWRGFLRGLSLVVAVNEWPELNAAAHSHCRDMQSVQRERLVNVTPALQPYKVRSDLTSVRRLRSELPEALVWTYERVLVVWHKLEDGVQEMNHERIDVQESRKMKYDHKGPE